MVMSGSLQAQRAYPLKRSTIHYVGSASQSRHGEPIMLTRESQERRRLIAQQDGAALRRAQEQREDAARQLSSLRVQEGE